MSVVAQIKSNNKLKQLAHWLLIPANEHRPRLWVKWFLNPFKHSRGKHSIIRRRTRVDVLPFNNFRLGEYSVIEDFCTVNNGVGDVYIGDRSLIGMGNVIIGPVKIGNDVILAQNIVISGLNHGYEDVSIPPSMQKVTTKQIELADNIWIGANAVITAGVKIGKHCVIGAGSVVTKDIPDYCVVVGNPAKVVKKYNPNTDVWERV
jgi:acetyltransferase-like isoleucine patch superfamily enzyme